MSLLSPRLFLLAAVGLAGFMLYGSLSPALAPPGEYGADKLLHTAAYGTLAGLMALGTRNRQGAVIAILLAIAFGGMVEIAQGFIPERSGSWGDFAANSLGAILVGGAFAARRWRVA